VNAKVDGGAQWPNQQIDSVVLTRTPNGLVPNRLWPNGRLAKTAGANTHYARMKRIAHKLIPILAGTLSQYQTNSALGQRPMSPFAF